MSSFVRVLIDRSEGRELDYAIPEELRNTVKVGERVVVKVRNRRALGTILALMEHSAVPGIRMIEGLVGQESTLPPVMMKLAQWMADYYCAPLASVMRSMLPPMLRGEKVAGKKIRMAELLKSISKEEMERLARKAPKQHAILSILQKTEGTIPVDLLLKESGGSDASLRAIVSADWVRITEVRSKDLGKDGEKKMSSGTNSP